MLSNILGLYYLTIEKFVLECIIFVSDPFTKGKNLHTTFIRNEAAFYRCISQVTQCIIDCLIR